MASEFIIDNQFKQVISNFSLINQGLKFSVGNMIDTVSPTNTIYSIAKINQYIEKSFCIYDLKKFITALKLFDSSHDITLNYENDRNIIIKDNNIGDSVSYACCAEDTIKLPSDKMKTIFEREYLFSFSMKKEEFNTLLKFVSILDMSSILIEKIDSHTLMIKTVDLKNPSSNFYSKPVSLPHIDISSFNSIQIKKENLIKLIDSDIYEISICDKPFIKIKTENDVEYFIVGEIN